VKRLFSSNAKEWDRMGKLFGYPEASHRFYNVRAWVKPAAMMTTLFGIPYVAYRWLIKSRWRKKVTEGNPTAVTADGKEIKQTQEEGGLYEDEDYEPDDRPWDEQVDDDIQACVKDFRDWMRVNMDGENITYNKFAKWANDKSRRNFHADDVYNIVFGKPRRKWRRGRRKRRSKHRQREGDYTPYECESDTDDVPANVSEREKVTEAKVVIGRVPIDTPEALVQIRTDTQFGNGVIVGDFCFTAAHLFDGDNTFGTIRFKDGEEFGVDFTINKDEDFAYVHKNKIKRSVKSMKIAPPTEEVLTSLGIAYTILSDDDKYVGYTSMSPGEVVNGLVYHTMHTEFGVSGAALLSGQRVVGIHLGYDPDRDQNYGIGFETIMKSLNC
jgi:hypothetical protein